MPERLSPAEFMRIFAAEQPTKSMEIARELMGLLGEGSQESEKAQRPDDTASVGRESMTSTPSQSPGRPDFLPPQPETARATREDTYSHTRIVDENVENATEDNAAPEPTVATGVAPAEPLTVDQARLKDDGDAASESGVGSETNEPHTYTQADSSETSLLAALLVQEVLAFSKDTLPEEVGDVSVDDYATCDDTPLRPQSGADEPDTSRRARKSKPSSKLSLRAKVIAAGAGVMLAAVAGVVVAPNLLPKEPEEKRVEKLLAHVSENWLVGDKDNLPFATIVAKASGEYAIQYGCNPDACTNEKGEKTSLGVLSKGSDGKALSWTADFSGANSLPLYIMKTPGFTGEILKVNKTPDGKLVYEIDQAGLSVTSKYNPNAQGTQVSLLSNPPLKADNPAYKAGEADLVNKIASNVELAGAFVKIGATTDVLTAAEMGKCGNQETTKVDALVAKQMAAWLRPVATRYSLPFNPDQIVFINSAPFNVAANTDNFVKLPNGTSISTIKEGGRVAMKNSDTKEPGIKIDECKVEDTTGKSKNN